MQDFAKILKEEMDKLNLTTTALARQSGVSYSSIYSYLAGSAPNLFSAHLLLKTLGVEMTIGEKK